MYKFNAFCRYVCNTRWCQNKRSLYRKHNTRLVCQVYIKIHSTRNYGTVSYISCKHLVKKQAKKQEECDHRNNFIPFCVSIKIFIGLLKKDKVLLHVLHLKVCSRKENLPNLHTFFKVVCSGSVLR